MANNDEIRQGSSKRDRDPFDRMIDGALAKYASAEPHPGLEERVLANLDAELRTASRAWWIWGFAAAMAAIILVAGTFAMRWSQPAHPSVTNHPTIEPRPVVPHLATREASPASAKKAASHRVAAHPADHELAAVNPKLDVFPSPLPLSEQEKILALYVGHYPEHAALVAEARMNDLRQEESKRREIVRGEGGGEQ